MEITAKTPAPTGLHAIAWCDGSCPANPGPMGIGFRLVLNPALETTAGEDNQIIEFGYRLGPGTNNKAEYHALIATMREALRRGVTHLEVHTDSMLMAQQVVGNWKVKDHELHVLHQEATGLAALFTEFDIHHIRREYNADADRLSKNPTDPSLPPPVIEIDLATPVRRKLTRQQAAMVRFWWKTHRCQNEYRLARIFGGTPSHMGRIGRGEQYADITERDLPAAYHPPHTELQLERA